jgi:hypothetical protein
MRAFSSKSRVCAGVFRPRHLPGSRNVSVSANFSLARRDAMLTLCGVALTASAAPAVAEVELATLYGLATPPTSYGGYGGNKDEAPKYSFVYPATWKRLTVNKVQKVVTVAWMTRAYLFASARDVAHV